VTRIVRAAACALVALFSSATLLGRADPPAAVPLVPGLTFVLAVHNTAPAGNTTVKSVAQGDYELVVAVTGVDSGGIDETTRIEGVDENKQPIEGPDFAHTDVTSRFLLQVNHYWTKSEEEFREKLSRAQSHTGALRRQVEPQPGDNPTDAILQYVAALKARS